MNREPAVAGQFYPSSPSELSQQVGSFIREAEIKERVIGAVSPHAGLIYSGKVAGAVYSAIEMPETVILCGPNHTGIGDPVSIVSSGYWRMPTGKTRIDETVAGRLKDSSDVIHENSLAHQMEHSLEVQLPFLIYFKPDIKIVPVSIMTDSLNNCREIGEAIADVINSTVYPVNIIASSDMSHYVSDSTAREKDGMAIERIKALDPEGLYRTVKKERISMCGVLPVTTMLYAALKLGAKEAGLVKYMTSAEVSGDFEYVVGYSGMIIK